MERKEIQDFNQKVEQLKTIFDREDVNVKYVCGDDCKELETVKTYTDENGAYHRETSKLLWASEILIVGNHLINVACNSKVFNLGIVAGALTERYTFLGDKKPMGYIGHIKK